MRKPRSSAGTAAILLFIGLLPGSAAAQEPAPYGRPIPPPPRLATLVPVPPAREIEVDAQRFPGSLLGFRRYLESIRSSDPALYAALDPELGRLEGQRTAAQAALLSGFALGSASIIYGFASTSGCPRVSASDDAWTQCHDDNLDRIGTFGLIGMSAMGVGLLSWHILGPSSSDIAELIYDHNRQSPRQLRWDVGYDPVRRVTFGAATLAF